MKYDVVTIGDASEDIFVRPRDMKVFSDTKFVTGRAVSFELGEKILLDDVQYEIGGSACNNAVALARQGYSTAAILALGHDTPAEKIEQRLTEEGVNQSLVKKQHKYKTNFSVIFNIADERTIFVYHGLDDYSCLTPPKKLASRWLFITPIGEGDEKIFNTVISLVAEKNLKIIWNPGVVQIAKRAQHFKQLLSHTSILFLNREEALKFVGFPVTPKIEDVVKTLNEFGVKIVVVTDGKNGATAYDGENFYHADALTQERVDATGAGDSFASGFAGRIMEEVEYTPEIILDALKWGVVNSTSVVSYVGAQRGLLTKSQIRTQTEAAKGLNVRIVE